MDYPNVKYFNGYLYFQQEKAAQTLDFILSVVGRLESDKHSLALKEIVALTSRLDFICNICGKNSESIFLRSSLKNTSKPSYKYLLL